MAVQPGASPGLESDADAQPAPLGETDVEEPGNGSVTRTARVARWVRDVRNLPTIVGWAALAAFTVLSIGTPLIGVGTFLQSDMLTHFAPWQAVFANPGLHPNAMVGDTVDFVAPQSMLIVDAARAGHLEQWSPYVMGGSELGGLPNSGVYSPLSIPWWVLPHALAPGAVKLLEIVTVTVGMSLLLRRLRLPGATWPVASLAYASSGFMIAWTNWPQTRVAALIPLLFWAIDRAAVVSRWVDAVPLGAVLAGMLLGGFPAVTAYALYAGAGWALFRVLQARRLWRGTVRGLAVCLAGLVVGGLLSAWQMLPFAVNTLTVVDFSVRSFTQDVHLPFDVLATSLLPGISGDPDLGVWRGHPVGTFSFVGVTVWLLALAALVGVRRLPDHRGALWFLVAAVLTVGTLVYVGGAPLGLALKLPLMDSSHIGRARVVIGFFVAMLAALGYTAVLRRAGLVAGAGPASADVRLTSVETGRLVREPRATMWWQVGAAWVMAAGLVVVVVVAVRQAWPLVPVDVAPVVARQAVEAVVVALLTLAVIGLAGWMPGGRAAALAVAVLPILVAVQATAVAQRWWPTSSSASFYAATPTHEFLAEHLGDDRFEPVGQTMLPGTNTAYRLRSLGGHNFPTVQWKDLLRAADPLAMATPTYARLSVENVAASATSPILDRLAVRYLVAGPSLLPLGDGQGSLRRRGLVDLGSGEPISCGPRQGPVRGVALRLAEVPPTPDGVTVSVRLVAEDSGEVLAESQDWRPVLNRTLAVSLPGEDIDPGRSWRAVVTLTGQWERLQVNADASGRPALRTVVPADDGLRVVHTGDATIYERTKALPRVRWATRSVLVEDAQSQVRLLAAGKVPADAVLLERQADVRSGASGQARITDLAPGSTGRQEFSVDAAAPGWLVVEDSMRRRGWSVTIDGQAAQLVPADHAAAAVHVPAGDHVVELTYRTPGLAAGTAVTGAGVALLVLVLILGRRRRTTGRRNDAARSPQLPTGG